MRAFPQGLFFPIGPIWTRLSPIKIRRPVVIRGSGEGRVLTFSRHLVTHDLRHRGPSGDPRTTKTTTGRQFFIGYCFSTCLKIVARHFSGIRPSEDWGDRARSSPECIGQCSQVPDYFRKNAADRPKRIGYYRDQRNPWWNVDIYATIWAVSSVANIKMAKW